MHICAQPAPSAGNPKKAQIGAKCAVDRDRMLVESVGTEWLFGGLRGAYEVSRMDRTN